jgi:hypothetical protein
MRSLTVEIAAPGPDLVLAPLGTSTPHDAVSGLQVTGGRITQVLTEAELGLSACLIETGGGPLVLHYDVAPPPNGHPYPDAAFRPRDNRFTRPASELAQANRGIAARAGGGRAAIEAIVAETEARFAYAHPERRFNDDSDAVPYLACGTTPGSCVDINTYLVASLRAAGFEAAYLYGYFFPAERGGVTYDMHCWVATRHEGEILEWDIAHHMKASLGATRAALNPRPGQRVALGHSMGHRYRSAGGELFLKLLAEPMQMRPDMTARHLDIIARLPFGDDLGSSISCADGRLASSIPEPSLDASRRCLDNGSDGA